MSIVTQLPPHCTTGRLGMYNGTKDDKDPYIDFGNNTANIDGFREVPIVAEDIRYMDPQPAFAKDGYEFRSHKHTALTAEQLLNGKSSPDAKKLVDDHYMPEVTAIIQDATKGTEVIPYSFRLRTQIQDGKDVLISKVGYGSVNVAHVDRDITNAHFRLRTSLGEERAEQLLAKYKRWASVNVWRPLGCTVQKWPLVFVNHADVAGWDYETHMVRIAALNDPAVLDRGEKGHETILRYDLGYKYHYVSNVTPDEVLVFASFHSDPSKVVPHGAFWDDSTLPDAPTRSSIEARCWVFWDEEDAE